MRITFILISMVISTALLSQLSSDLRNNNKGVVLGLEAGYGINRIESTGGPSYDNVNNIGAIVGLVVQKKLGHSHVYLSSGIKYQRRGHWNDDYLTPVISNNLLLPIEINFVFPRKTKIRLRAIGGFGMSLTLNGDFEQFAHVNTFTGNVRFGGGIELDLFKSVIVSIQILKSYDGVNYSNRIPPKVPGIDSGYTVDHCNRTTELTLMVGRRF